MAKFPFYKQIDQMDCGPSCIRIISKHFGKEISIKYLQDLAKVTKVGSSMHDLSSASEAIGFRTLSVKIPFTVLISEKPFPAILHWQKKHYVVVYKISKTKVYLSDPAIGLISYTHEEFLKSWTDGSKHEGIALLYEPTPRFHEINEDKEDIADKKVSMKYFFKFLHPHRKLMLQMVFSLIAGSLLGLITPFLTQALIDEGVQKRNLKFVYLILIAQLMAFIGTASVGAIRNWLLLHVSTRLNISIISDFLIKLMKLPIVFFDRKNMGDILQRIRDHDRIKLFLTSSSLDTLFSMTNMVIFGAILLYYNGTIFMIYFFASILYLVWILAFLKKRKEIDYKRFNESAALQGTEIQLVQGMQEIKLNQAEKYKRWEWERNQIRLFRVSISSLKIEQFQSIGGAFINEGKNILIIIFAATKVIEGNMTLGMMMATSQIIGQLNGPLQQLVNFIQQAQDAKISLDRLSDVHNRKDEDSNVKLISDDKNFNAEFKLENVYFKYGGDKSPWVLKDLNLTIPKGKTTAIVGLSGSGKTTLLKLLLKFYEPLEGKIHLGEKDLSTISAYELRKNCGVVMQEGYIFSDTIYKNITISSEYPDQEKFEKAIKLANISEFIHQLPLGQNTKIGSDGIGLSTGQRQRIMIARAIYKNPEIIFLDEATSSLDASNEKEITENINLFSKDKTTIIIAHRLSTVKNSDQIIVLQNGHVTENGTHNELIKMKGAYYRLIKDQLDLE